MTTSPTCRNSSTGAPDRRQWLVTLGALTAGRMPVDEARTRITAYLAMLDDVPDEAFTKETLRICAARFKWFPSYAEVREALLEHIRSQRRTLEIAAPQKALPAPPMSEEEREYRLAKLAEIRERLADSLTAPQPQKPRSHLPREILNEAVKADAAAR